MLNSFCGNGDGGAADAKDPGDLALGGTACLADGPKDGELAGVEFLTGEEVEDTGLAEGMVFPIQVEEAEKFLQRGHKQTPPNKLGLQAGPTITTA